MSIERKLLGTADAAATEANYIEDCFSCYLYTGTGANQTITNGIDLSTNGGLVWIKNRNSTDNHVIVDSSGGPYNRLASNTTDAYSFNSTSNVLSLNTDGFSVGSAARVNGSGNGLVSWTFRKQAKFCDIVTYTGNGASNRSIAHNLGATPGMIIVKCTSVADNWAVYHKSLSAGYVMFLNTTAASASEPNSFTTTAPTSTNFYVSTNGEVNGNGRTFVAYLFADSNSGGFGPAGTDSVVACGSFVGSTSNISLGWEPQYVIIKRTDSTGSWWIGDNMRGVATGGDDKYLLAESSAAESAIDFVDFTATGFTQKLTTSGTANFIYLAIRRGPMKTPTDATKVFAPVAYTGSGAGQTVTTGMPVDLTIVKSRSDAGTSNEVWDRLRGSGLYLIANTTDADGGFANQYKNDSNTGIKWAASDGWSNNNGSTYGSWNFRRAPGFFDVVCYTGTGSATTVAHNLGVSPDMWIVKRRDGLDRWAVGTSVQGSKVTELQKTNGEYDAGGAYFGNGSTYTAPNASAITLATHAAVNGSGNTYVAYLFATCPGVSKVFNFTGNGSSQTINCGFAAGARFVLIKRTDAAGDWWVYDSARGIVSAADPALALNSTAAEVTSADAIDPDSSGFIVNQETTCNVNVNNATYIGLAIA